MFKTMICGTALAAAMALASTADAAEFRIGEALEINGMSFQPVYIQAVMMSHETHGGHGGHAAPAKPAAMDHSGHDGGGGEGDVHLEVDVATLAKNDFSFPAGSWVPYLTITYKIAKVGGDWKAEGAMVPMLASDGPHYGDNLPLDGPGKYKLTVMVAPPSDSVFPRHVDKETGAGAWWPPFENTWEFTFVGVGKKGGY